MISFQLRVRMHADDCIIPVVNAISRGEFDEFTTRFYEGTKRTEERPPLWPRAPSPPPPPLIYARRYLCQRIYIPIFIIRNIIARAFIALVEKPGTPGFAVHRFSFSPLSPDCLVRGACGRHARCDLSKPRDFYRALRLRTAHSPRENRDTGAPALEPT